MSEEKRVRRTPEQIAADWIFVRRKIKNPAAFRRRDGGIEGYQVIQAAPCQAYQRSHPASFRISVPA